MPFPAHPAPPAPVPARAQHVAVLALELLARLLLARRLRVRSFAVDRLQRPAVELAEALEHPLVDGVGEEQHFLAALRERLEVRRLPQRLRVLASEEPD